MDAMSPWPRSEAAARYELARLAEVLPQVTPHLVKLGVDADEAGSLGARAMALHRDIMAARAAALDATARRITA